MGVLSIDPSSPFTRGRDARRPDPARGPLPRPWGVHPLDGDPRLAGGLAEAALQAALLMDASGKDDVLLETVGVGQGEIDIVDHADTIVLALMPGSGDSVQALKAGRDGDPGRDRRQQVRPSAGRHDGPRGSRRPSLGPEGPGRCRWCEPRHRRARGSPSCSSGSTTTAGTSRRRARSPSAGLATCAPRCWGSPRRGCGAGSRIEPPTTPSGGAARRGRPARDRSRHRGAQAAGAGRDRLSRRRAAEPAGRDPKTTLRPASSRRRLQGFGRPVERRWLPPARGGRGDDHARSAAAGPR